MILETPGEFSSYSVRPSGSASSNMSGAGSTNLPPVDQDSANPSKLDPDRLERLSPEKLETLPGAILLVEDNPTDVFVIKKVLAGSGVNLSVHVATDGQQALDYMLERLQDPSLKCPALVLLDLNIPKVGGLDVLREFRASTHFSRTPVIIVTSSGASADRKAAQTLGADAYFRKPTSLAAFEELGELIKRALGML